MAGNTFVVSFGCPRSGTTAIRKILWKLGPDCFVSKLPETKVLHPCLSNTGLVDLANWLAIKDRLMFVRTVRHPLEVCESFEAARTVIADKTPDLAKNDDASVLKWIRSESEGFAAQRSALEAIEAERPGQFCLVTARYECLGNAQAREPFLRRVGEFLGPTERHALEAALEYQWGKVPARAGRLSAGVGGVLTPERREWFGAQLAHVIEREGYECSP